MDLICFFFPWNDEQVFGFGDAWCQNLVVLNAIIFGYLDLTGLIVVHIVIDHVTRHWWKTKVRPANLQSTYVSSTYWALFYVTNIKILFFALVIRREHFLFKFDDLIWISFTKAERLKLHYWKPKASKLQDYEAPKPSDLHHNYSYRLHPILIWTQKLYLWNINLTSACRKHNSNNPNTYLSLNWVFCLFCNQNLQIF